MLMESGDGYGSYFRICKFADALKVCQSYMLKSKLRDFWQRLRGKTNDLARMDEIARELGAFQQIACGVQTLPLGQIVGSVSRNQDFTCDFFPRRSVDKRRWASIYLAYDAMKPMPPIDVYQIGGVYFVADGHHRVSVACRRGCTYIDANVIKLDTPVELTVEAVRARSWCNQPVSRSHGASDSVEQKGGTRHVQPVLQ
jgi:hypothetical protein